MKAYLATLLAPSAVVLSSYGYALASNNTYECKFEAGFVVIDVPGPDGTTPVAVAGKRHAYARHEEKLIPHDTGLPTLLFQPGLNRWKILNESGETIEIAVCKSSRASSH